MEAVASLLYELEVSARAYDMDTRSDACLSAARGHPRSFLVSA